MAQPTIFNRKQGIGLILFLVFVGLIRVFIYFLPQPAISDYTSADSLYIATNHPVDTIILQPFDPNTADSLTLRQRGLAPWQIRNMLRYRAKGGRYRTQEDFRRLYGLTDSTYQVLKPFIAIDTMPFYVERQERLLRDSLRKDSIQKRYEARKDSMQNAYQQRRDSLIAIGKIHEKKDTIIELNQADTNDLKYLKGIGSYVARQIVHYRQQLGGYYSYQQLYEIERLDFVVWDSILPHLTIDTTLITPIAIQSASVERLMHHPYLNFTQAKAIYETRRRKIRLSGMADISPSILTEKEAQRIRPYLQFDE